MMLGRPAVRVPLIALLVLGALGSVRPAAAQLAKRASRSHVTLIAADGSDKTVIYTADQVFEAPNWTPDGNHLILNSQGRLWKLAVAGGKPEAIETGTVKKINNDHGVSPDGSLFAISAGQIYVLPSQGGCPGRSPS
jgi:TolB protein